VSTTYFGVYGRDPFDCLYIPAPVLLFNQLEGDLPKTPQPKQKKDQDREMNKNPYSPQQPLSNNEGHAQTEEQDDKIEKGT
jgi:hypothetical protein